MVLDSAKAGHWNIYILSVESGVLRQLTTGPDEDGRPSWSHNGRWIYFGSDRSGTWQVWRVPAEGGPPAQVTKRGGDEPFESPDGKFLYYHKQLGAIWKVPVDGGDETQVIDHAIGGHRAVLPQGICLLNPGANPLPALEFFNFSTRRLKKFAELPSDVRGTFEEPGMRVSPDGSWVLYDRADHIESAIQLVENFR